MQRFKADADRARRLADRIVARMRAVARLAGLDPSIPSLHAHNALVALDYGQPWAGIDYALARRVLWLEQLSFKPGRIVSQWHREGRYAEDTGR